MQYGYESDKCFSSWREMHFPSTICAGITVSRLLHTIVGTPAHSTCAIFVTFCEINSQKLQVEKLVGSHESMLTCTMQFEDHTGLPIIVILLASDKLHAHVLFARY